MAHYAAVFKKPSALCYQGAQNNMVDKETMNNGPVFPSFCVDGGVGGIGSRMNV